MACSETSRKLDKRDCRDMGEMSSEFSFGLLRYDNYVYLCHDRYQFKHNNDPRTNSAYKNVGFFEDGTGASYGWIKNVVMVGEPPYVIEWISELGERYHPLC